MLECRNLEKKYLGKIAVRDISLSIGEGRVCALLGPNGSGKTTWMKMVSGLIAPNAGTITFFGQPIGKETKKHIAYMSTEPFFYSYMTAKDVGKYYKDFFEDFDMEKYVNLVERLGLRMQDKAKTLSSGLAAKLKLAATLARRASLYLLDEPLNGIDIIAREQIIEAVMEVADKNATIVMSSHLVDELEKFIDDAVFVKEGSIVLSGEAEMLRNQHGKTIVELYKEIYA
ncbi:MAG: ABC transporter ATP-binding protein [Lachnospiraceae bacterium]|jgi:ABC-2 type transport system ATP-binding protein|nr:ABC transporter ATP-binding protein [Lachnospiraceae bacterium]